MIAFVLEKDGLYKETVDWTEADWLHFENPSSEEITYLVEKEEIPLDFVTDGLDRYKVPRKEFFKNKNGESVHLLLVLYPKVKTNYEDYQEYRTLPLSIIISDQRIYTISSETPSFLKTVYRNETEENGNQLRGQHIVLDIIWEMTHSYIQGIMEIDRTIEEMEKNIVSTTKNEAFYKLITIHKNLVYFDTGITENHKIIKHLIDSDLYADYPKGNSLLHDIRVISHQAAIMVSESIQMIDHLSEVFSSVISNNLNNIMKFLTSLTIVLTIPTIVGSFWGMNVDLPISKSPLAFLLLIFISILLSIGTVFWLKKKDYL